MNDDNADATSATGLSVFCQSAIDNSSEFASDVFLFRDPSGRLPPSLLVGYTLWLPPGVLLPRYVPPSLVYVQSVHENALDITVGMEVPPGTLIETFSPACGKVSIGTVIGNETPPFRMHDGGPLFLVDD